MPGKLTPDGGEPSIRGKYDVVVGGAGTAGCVLLVEAGGRLVDEELQVMASMVWWWPMPP